MVKCGPVALSIFCASVLTYLVGAYLVWSSYSNFLNKISDPAKLLKEFDCGDGVGKKEFKPAWAAAKQIEVDPRQCGEGGRTLIDGALFIKKDSGKECSAVFDGLKVEGCKDEACTALTLDKRCETDSLWEGYTRVADFGTYIDIEGYTVWKVTSEEPVYFSDQWFIAHTALSTGVTALFTIAYSGLISGVVGLCCCCCSLVACLVTPSEGSAAREPMQMQLA